MPRKFAGDIILTGCRLSTARDRLRNLRIPAYRKEERPVDMKGYCDERYLSDDGGLSACPPSYVFSLIPQDRNRLLETYPTQIVRAEFLFFKEKEREFQRAPYARQVIDDPDFLIEMDYLGKIARLARNNSQRWANIPDRLLVVRAFTDERKFDIVKPCVEKILGEVRMLDTEATVEVVSKKSSL